MARQQGIWARQGKTCCCQTQSTDIRELCAAPTHLAGMKVHSHRAEVHQQAKDANTQLFVKVMYLTGKTMQQAALCKPSGRTADSCQARQCEGCITTALVEMQKSVLYEGNSGFS